MREFQSSQEDLNRSVYNVSADDTLPPVTRNWNTIDNQIWWGQSYQQVFGQTVSSSMTESSWFENIHPSDKNRVMSSLKDAFNMHQVEWSASYKIKKADNSYLDVQDTAVISYQENIPVQLVGFMKVKHAVPEAKIDEMKQIASIALEASDSASSDGQEKILSIAYDINNEIQAIAQQRRLLSIIEHSADVISVFDHDGKFTYVNEIGKKLLDIKGIDKLTISHIFHLPMHIG